MSSLLPERSCRVRLFQQREVFRKPPDGLDGWELWAEQCTPSLTQQINDWLQLVSGSLQSVGAPNTNVFFLDTMQQVQCYLTSVLITYLPATEGNNDPTAVTTSVPATGPAPTESAR